MIETQKRQYLDDTPRDVQDLIYDGNGQEAVRLLSEQKGLGKVKAVMEMGGILRRMKEEFPNAEIGESSTSLAGGMSPQTKKTITRAVLTFLILFGGLLCFVGILRMVNASASGGWPSTEGKVLVSSVEIEYSTSKKSSGMSYKNPTYSANIIYEFMVDGTSYKGERIAYGDYGGRESHAESIVKRYPVGMELKVYYKPGDPEECLIETGMKAQAFLMPSMGLLLLLVAGVIFIVVRATNKDDGEELERKAIGNH